MCENALAQIRSVSPVTAHRTRMALSAHRDLRHKNNCIIFYKIKKFQNFWFLFSGSVLVQANLAGERKCYLSNFF